MPSDNRNGGFKMTLSLKSLNSAIEAVQAEVKATDDLNAKLAETIARLEALETIAESRKDVLTTAGRVIIDNGNKLAAMAERLEKAEKRLDIQAGWCAELFNRTGAMAEWIDTLEKRHALTEAARAVKVRAKAVWKAAMA